MTSLFLQIFNETIDKLTNDGILNDLVSSFGIIKDIDKKTEFIDEILKKYLRWPEILLRKSKSNERSVKMRYFGNQHFATADYLMALKMYNKSICYAENDSEEMNLAFANRSAVYFKLELYNDCLKNIELAKKGAFPARLMDKLDKRKALCLKQRPNEINRSALIVTELSFPANPQVPFIANCLQVQKSAQYGRHIITTSNLKSGDIVAIEESFCSSLPKTLKYMRCENCLMENHRNLIPCKHCTSAMFCGDECYDEAYHKFHKFECPFIDYIIKMFHNNQLLALRTILCATTAFKSVDELVAFVEETKGQDLTVFNCNFQNKSWNAYGPVHFLKEENMTDLEEFTEAIIAAMIYQPLLESTDLGEMFTTTKAINVFKQIALHSVKLMGINKFQSSFMLDDVPDDSQTTPYQLRKPLALSMHPFRSLFSHSCAPNVICSPYGKKVVFTISRPIEAGEQLFDNYGCDFASSSFIERQVKFKHFKCQCVACENKYPLYDELAKGAIPKLDTDKSTSLQSVKQVHADYINKYANYFPCNELVLAEGVFRYFLGAVYAGLTMEQRFK